MDIIDSYVVGLVYDLGFAAKGLGVEVMTGSLELRLLLPNQRGGDLASCGREMRVFVLRLMIYDYRLTASHP